ncbi:hypothetical protein BD626DRAFT_229580 [Schizophyllum amplum]|uniref:Uncharacterized protein n=1 Tax=Schizophyllum amplum TaxID=97359 RepID=A0A550BWF6_9AGAR|nr:hypothetical protein BD626DRAFT_229580 [Auriculariopsis ampla]
MIEDAQAVLRGARLVCGDEGATRGLAFRAGDAGKHGEEGHGVREVVLGKGVGGEARKEGAAALGACLEELGASGGYGGHVDLFAVRSVVAEGRGAAESEAVVVVGHGVRVGVGVDVGALEPGRDAVFVLRGFVFAIERLKTRKGTLGLGRRLESEPVRIVLIAVRGSRLSMMMARKITARRHIGTRPACPQLHKTRTGPLLSHPHLPRHQYRTKTRCERPAYLPFPLPLDTCRPRPMRSLRPRPMRSLRPRPMRSPRLVLCGVL